MLRHFNDAPALPQRVLVLGAGGFVGGALMRRLAIAGAPAVGITRKELDLLDPEAAARLAALLAPGDAIVAVAARAPVKDMAMMADNMIMVQALADALARVPVAQVVNISSDA